LRAEADCQLQESARRVGPLAMRGTLILHARPAQNAPSAKLDVVPGMPVIPLRVHGRTDALLMGARRFGKEWLEVDVSGTRGWVHRRVDFELLGLEPIDRC
jgi:hypothetical protein